MNKYLIHCDNNIWCGCWEDYCAYANNESEIEDAAEDAAWEAWNSLAGGFQSLVDETDYDDVDDIPEDELEELFQEEQAAVTWEITLVESEDDEHTFELLESDNKVLYDGRKKE